MRELIDLGKSLVLFTVEVSKAVVDAVREVIRD